jgi:Nif-specific regulatory protein
MENNHAAASVKREVKELLLLFQISQVLDRSMDLREVVGPVLEAIGEHMGMVRGTLTLLNRKSGEILIEAAQGLSDSQMERGRYKRGEGVTGKVVATGQPAVVPHISEEPLFLDRTGARRGVPRSDVSFICVPIKMGNEVIGTLSADRVFAEGVSFEEDVRLLAIIASMISQAVSLRQSAQEERHRLMEENSRLQDQLKERFRPSNIVGNSKGMRIVYDLISQVSKSEATVLIRGESGTGKELVAHAIHFNSLRAGRPFIKVNCGALPESVVESELFGHERGAFTGAIAMRK